MHTRPVGADELNPFVEAASAPDHRREVEHYLESMFTAGSMHPEWCFVAEEEQGDPRSGVSPSGHCQACRSPSPSCYST